MMTSKAISKVTNMIAVNRKAVEQRFPQRDLADHPHEAGDQQEARDIEPEKLRGQAEQQRRHEHRHDPAKLRAGDEGFGRLLARQKGGDSHRGWHRPGSPTDRTGNSRPAGRSNPRRCRCASCRSRAVAASASSSSDTAISTDAVAGHRGRIGLRRGRIVDDNFNFGLGHGLFGSIGPGSSAKADDRTTQEAAICGGSPYSAMQLGDPHPYRVAQTVGRDMRSTSQQTPPRSSATC